ncbi:DUF58 domain-containing protein [Deinococcus metallilatus]|uniref:DUF58 domain-containing protein n=1 Tax=Deinococcus metallilatus TaxID=1211322 RepID=A0AAJ5F4J6_9DEIO|nr:DUF58 domain-containing protein [Deinococcus metallilatus]MBB5294493.1 uncharacterized protein (DUF58 family) [Deinococcus metallilatus]QBY07544.1 DUF58 domain-containing protein [Deinococcus metallilatus]RXJ13960.1 DUF58 domain-containing protein [Deinococcus metallilatus]TLK29925.1 DUF58 domain-containing protein [Deinococcus metallilatus]GMA15708.1 hypothetical protein GCM10025871_20390 [Deinococcus metallilatus]
MELPPALQQELARRRLTAPHARAQGGVGERPSRAKGAGIEFADHRPYQPGDDIRALDAVVTARLGTPVVREFVVAQQLPVLVVLDASASMRIGRPPKFGLAAGVAGALAFVALAGGDAVQAFTFGRSVRVSARLQGVNRATELLGWLGQAHAEGAGTLEEAVGRAASRAPRGALVILVSDFLSEDALRALDTAHARAQEVLAVQVLAPEEREPERLRAAPGRADPLRLDDVEGGGSAVVTLDDATLDRYRRALAAWTAELRAALARHGGRLVQVQADQPLGEVMLREFLARGIIR